MRRRWLLFGALRVLPVAPLAVAMPLLWGAASGTSVHAGEPTSKLLPLAAGDTVPWPQMTLLDGRRIGADTLTAQAVVVVFFTTTCPFCRRHLAHVQQLHLAAREAGRPLTVLAVARENDLVRVRRHVQAMGYTFDVTADHQALSAMLAPRNVVPLTVTVDRRGRLVRSLAGEMAEDDTMELLALADTPVAGRR